MDDLVELQNIDGQLLTDSQDITNVLESIGCTTPDISGVVAVVGDGEYKHVYVTDSARPWLVDALYWRVL